MLLLLSCITQVTCISTSFHTPLLLLLLLLLSPLPLLLLLLLVLPALPSPNHATVTHCVLLQLRLGSKTPPLAATFTNRCHFHII
jgi:hypothetical protein